MAQLRSGNDTDKSTVKRHSGDAPEFPEQTRRRDGMGSKPTAAGGGVKEGERVTAVSEGRRCIVTKDIRWAPQQEVMTDSKSVGGDTVWVQLPPPAPVLQNF